MPSLGPAGACLGPSIDDRLAFQDAWVAARHEPDPGEHEGRGGKDAPLQGGVEDEVGRTAVKMGCT